MDEDADHKTAIRDTNGLEVLDPNGDLYLQVGEDVEDNAKTYLVCSKALARASPVFGKMLYGGFAESRRPPDGDDARGEDEGGWTVALPEDRHESTELLLYIAHGRFDKVPEQLDITQLYQFLVVVDKYDAAAATRPWARGWLDGVRAGTENPLLLGVAYTLGDAPTFDTMAREIAAGCLIDGDSDLVFGYAGDDRETYSYKLRNIECLVPPDLLEDAASARATLLTTMLKPYADLYAMLKHGDRCLSSPQNPMAGRRCDSILLGSLVRSLALQGIDLAAPDPAAAYRGSVAALQAALPRLELYTAHSSFSVAHPSSSSSGPVALSLSPPSPFGGFGHASHHPHFGFGIGLSACEHVLQMGLREGLESSLTLRDQVSFARPRHGEYLRKQASKTGLAS